MNLRQRHLVPLIITLLIPVVAFGNIPDINNCSIGTRATQDVSVLTCPACDGYALTQAQTFGGGVMDATIEVYIRNSAGQGIAGIWEEIILDDPGLCFCLDKDHPDLATNDNGYAEYALPLCTGGCAENLTLSGYLSGIPFLQNPIPFIKINSVDLNCDRVVDLVDLADFAAAYFGTVTYCVDFYWDGVMNLLDLAAFSQHYGHVCPMP